MHPFLASGRAWPSPPRPARNGPVCSLDDDSWGVRRRRPCRSTCC